MTSWVLRVCAILFSLTAFYASWNGFEENRAFDTRGEKALVEPLGEYVEEVTTTKQLGVAVNESTSHSAQIFFTTLDGKRIQVNRHIPDDVLSAFLSGADVTIEYLPEAPTTTRFAGHEARAALFAAIGLGVGALSWLFWRKM